MIIGNNSRFTRRFLSYVIALNLLVPSLSIAQLLPKSLQMYADQAPAILGGDFHQQKWVANFPKPLSSYGQFILAKEYGLIWHVTEPFASETVIKLSGSDSTNPQWRYVSDILLGILNMKSDVLLRHFALKHYSPKNADILVLTPVNEQLKNVITRIQVECRQFPQKIIIEETNGDKTVIVLSNHHRLTHLPKELDHE